MKEAADRILRPEQAAYLEGTLAPRDALLARMEAYAAERRHPISDPEVCALLTLVARTRAPRLIVEVGTNIGYGAIVLARAAPLARVLTVEKNPETCAVARGFIADAGLSSRVEVIEDDAIAFLERVSDGIGLAYIDCIKDDYPRYLDLLTPKLESGAVILADNVLWKGYVALSAPPEAETQRVAALRDFNARLIRAPFTGVILPLGDGVGYAVKS